jgi:hypothetical protein
MLSTANETGSLAVIKSLGLALKTIVWNGAIKPVARVTVGSVGYVAVNSVVYPVMLVGSGTVHAAKVAVEVTYHSMAMGIDIVAPTLKAGLAVVVGTGQTLGGELIGDTVAVTGAGLAGLKHVASSTVAVGSGAVGYASGKTVKYVGVPLAATGIVAGGSAVGVTLGGAEAVAGAVTLGAGEVAGATVKGGGAVVAGSTMVAGTAASTVAGVGLGVYELSKAVVVPTTYEIGSGIVLGYGSLSQLGAHSILAVSDFSYMVLSMEGPQWVLYAVKGDLTIDKPLKPGAVLDLDTMQQNGETIKRLPVSTQEMDAVIQNLEGDLPVQ